MIYITDTKPLCSDSLFQGLYLKTNEYFKGKIDAKRLRDDKNRTLAGACLLKKGLEKMGLNPDMRINEASKGKPYVDGVYFNISHSGDKAVCAFGTSEIGVDIEKIRPLCERLMDKIALPSERAKISAAKQIVRLWTRKEALAKCVGEGLGEDIFKTDLSEDVVRYGGVTYRLKSFELGEYMLSVCTEFDFPPEKIVNIRL
ncbi:MAG: 4'-phosphopantetheinyl transferase superfamily protein [Clostridia bacterium]|nr:4'-phosphopantetheinyl transferase superfamily protein [Clostridia bacterium]